MKAILCLCLAVSGVQAQDWYPRHNFSVSGGLARPRGDIGGSFRDSGSLSFVYGYRFARNFQADIGLDTAFGAAGVNDYLDTAFGSRRIRDYQFFLPLGGRAILPIKQAWISGGGGAAWLRYSEHLSQPSEDFKIDCPPCRSRSGWGYYGMVNAGVFVDHARRFRVGATAKMYRAHTDGDRFGDLPGFRTRDRWLLLGGEFGFSF